MSLYRQMLASFESWARAYETIEVCGSHELDEELMS